MKVHVNRNERFGSWGGGAKWVNAFYSFARSQAFTICSHTDCPDWFVIAGIDGEDGGISLQTAIAEKQQALRQGKRVQILLRVNDCDLRKKTNYLDSLLIDLSQYVDVTVFVSHWLQSYFVVKGWQCLDSSVIYNGVDSNIFKPNEKLNNGKINVVSAHWSDNELKGQWLNESMDLFASQYPEFSFTFIGRTKAQLKNSILHPPEDAPELGRLLGMYDVCVNASYADPGPNAVIESISCGLPTYVHRDGGGGAEFAGRSHIYDTWEQLESILLKKDFKKNSTSFDSWEHCIKRFVNHLQ